MLSLVSHDKIHVIVDFEGLIILKRGSLNAVDAHPLEFVERVVEADFGTSLPRRCCRIPLGILFLAVAIG